MATQTKMHAPLRDRRSRLCGLTLAIALYGARAVGAEDQFPPELVRFRPYAGNPVFTAQGPGHWDRQIRERGWILRCGPVWHLWFTGYDDPPSGEEGTRRLGHATSKDGLRWTRDGASPLLPELWIEDMVVVAHNGQFFMFAEGRHDRAHWLTSPDGVAWIARGPLDVRGTDGQPIADGPLGTPAVWFDDGTWRLLFERGDRAVWLATSKDLKVWTLVSDDPVLTPGPAEYDRAMIAVDQVIKYRGRYYAIYHGTGALDGDQIWTTNIAASPDGIHWTKYAGNPIVPGDRSSGLLVAEPTTDAAGAPGGSPAACDGCEFPAPTRFRLYTTHGEVEAFLPAE